VKPNVVGKVRTTEIDAYDVDGNTLLDRTEIETAVYPFLGPDRTRDDVESAREALEKTYQSHGYQSVVVEIPPQIVKDGIVKLHVVEAPVGQLRVVGSRYYSAEELKSEVPALQPGTVPDINAAQDQIAQANRLPGRRVTPLLKPGQEKGTVDVDLKVSDDFPYHASVELDNDHSAGTKTLRTTETVRDDNFLLTGNSATLTLALAPQRLVEQEVAAASDFLPILGTPWSLSTSGYYSNSRVATLGGTNVLGKGFSAGSHGILQLPAFDEFTQRFSVGMDFKQVSTVVAFPIPGSAAIKVANSTVDYAPLSMSYSVQNTTARSAFSATASTTVGVRGLGSGLAATEIARYSARLDFVRLNLDLTETYSFWDDLQAYARFSGQYADVPLISAEQFAAGGLTTVRGYLLSSAVGDEGLLESVELRSPSVARLLGTFPDEWRFFLFADNAQVTSLAPLPDQTAFFRLSSFGIGTRMWAFGRLSGQILLADPMTATTSSRAHQLYTEFSVKADF
jgi:hemolysin activation/secretion protein